METFSLSSWDTVYIDVCPQATKGGN